MTSETTPRRSATGREILGASWRMLRTDRDLLWLPVISAIACLVVAVVLFVPGFLIGRAEGGNDSVGGWFGAALAAFGATLIAIFFQAALVIGAFQRAEGRQPTLTGVLGEAWRLRTPVLSWALLTSTVGLAVRTLERRLGVLGSLLGFLGGLAWAIASFLVVPVVVAEGLGPVAAVKRSSQLLRDTWGTSLRTTVRYGVIVALVTAGFMVAGGVGIVLVVTESTATRVAGGALLLVVVVAFVAFLAVTGAVSTYARALLYRYAAGLPVAGVPEAALAGAFVPKRRRRR